MAFTVVFIHGPAAAGKHTIGTLVSEGLGIPLFHNHLTVDLVKTLFDFGTPGFVQLRADIWRLAFREAAAAQRSFVFTFHPEATVAPSLIGELAALITEAGGQLHYVALRCSDAAIEQRISEASRQQFGKLTDAAVYRQLKAQGSFEFPAFPEPLVVIDTEAMRPEAAAAQIVRAIEKAEV